MSFALRDYQVVCADSIFEKWKEFQSTLLCLFTAGGKTIIFAEVIRRMRPGRAIVLCNREELIFQASDKIKRTTGLNCEIEMADMVANANLFNAADVIVSTVQTQISGKSAKRMTRFNPEDFSLLVVDECHFSTSNSFREVIDYYKRNPKLKVLGVTATPDRHDKEALGPIYESVAATYGMREGIELGWLCDITQQFVPVAGLDYSHIKTVKGDLSLPELQAEMERQENIAGVCQPSLEVMFALPPKTLATIPVPQWGEYLKALGRPARCSIVFTASVAQANLCAEIFNRVMPGLAEPVDGKTLKDKRRDLLKRFASGEVRAIMNCGVLTHGFDEPKVECVFMARATKSRSLYEQMCLDAETEILTRRGWIGSDEIKDTDTVRCYDMIADALAWSPIESKVDRNLNPGETMICFDSPYAGFRISDQHNVLVRQITGRKNERGAWKLVPASEWANDSHDHEIMLAGTDITKGIGGGVPLSPDELKFIGLVMTDGSINKINNAITITQAEYQTWIPEIDEIIAKCGFKVTRKIIDRRGQGFPTEYKTVMWTISRGEPRGTDLDKSGWGKLEPFISKELAAPLMEANREQVADLLYGLHLGDGQKQVNEKWTRQSYHICTKRRITADRLQILCVQNGFKCNISYQNEVLDGPRGPRNAMMVVHVKDRPFLVVGGTTTSDRTRPVVEPYSPERVWCVTTMYGTIVTRRRGKVTVLGNCGRSTRTLPGVVDDPSLDTPAKRRAAIAASPKPYCRIIDFVGNSGKHRIITTADVLGGKQSGDALKRAVAKAITEGKPVKISRLLEQAEIDLENEKRKRTEERRSVEAAKRNHIVPKVDFSILETRPFEACNMTRATRYSKHYHEPPTQRQAVFLAGRGINCEKHSLTKTDAGIMVGKIKEAEATMPATPKQKGFLRWKKVECENLTKREASRLIEKLKAA